MKKGDKEMKVWGLIVILILMVVVSAFGWAAGANVAADNYNWKSVEQGNIGGSSFNAASVSVTRDLPEAVSPGEEFEVSLTQSGFPFNTGIVTETLPEGFEYVLGSLPSAKSEYDGTTNNLTITFENETKVTYNVTAGTEEEIENADEFSGTWTTMDLSAPEGKIYGAVEGDKTLEFTPAPTPTPTATAAPGGGNGGGNGGGGPPPSPPVGKSAYIHLNATPAEIPADGTSTSAITAFVWDGEEWVSENLTVNFSTSLGNINASAVIVNESAIAILTAGTKEGIANVTAEANLSGEIGVITNTTTVNFTTPAVTPTPTATPEITATETPTAVAVETPTVTVTPSPARKWGIPGFEGIFAVAGLLAVAYLVMRRRR